MNSHIWINMLTVMVDADLDNLSILIKAISPHAGNKIT